MDLYVLDLSWRGGLAVLAESREAAWNLLKSEAEKYPELHNGKDSLEEVPPGTTFRFYGDE